MNTIVVSILFTIVTVYNPFFHRDTELKKGVAAYHFDSKEACWEYYDNHPSFIYKRDLNNVYSSAATMKIYEIKGVGSAYITCMEVREDPTK